MRYAIVRNARIREEVTALLPSNYSVVREEPENKKAPHRVFVIAGEDTPDQTFEGYVIPRLRSASLVAEEIGPDHPLFPLEPAGENVWVPAAPAGPDPAPARPLEWEEI